MADQFNLQKTAQELSDKDLALALAELNDFEDTGVLVDQSVRKVISKCASATGTNYSLWMVAVTHAIYREGSRRWLSHKATDC